MEEMKIVLICSSDGKLVRNKIIQISRHNQQKESIAQGLYRQKTSIAVVRFVKNPCHRHIRSDVR